MLCYRGQQFSYTQLEHIKHLSVEPPLLAVKLWTVFQI